MITNSFMKQFFLNIENYKKKSNSNQNYNSKHELTFGNTIILIHLNKEESD